MTVIKIVKENADVMIGQYLNTAEDIKAFAPHLERYSRVYSTLYKDMQFVLNPMKDPNYAFEYEGRGDGSDLSTIRFNLDLYATSGNNHPAKIATWAYFSLGAYPHCCAMKQLNGFYYVDNMSADQVDRFMQLCFKIYRTVVDDHTHRVIMNMVEAARMSFATRGPDLAADEVPNIEDPVMSFSHFYTWAKKQRRMSETCMRNHNTGRVIHHMEVIVNP